MKKFARFSLLLVTPLLLNSCAKNAHAFRALKNYDLIVALSEEEELENNGLIETNANFLLDLFMGEMSFALFIHLPYCSACNRTFVNFEEYLKERNYLIFSYDASLSDYSTLTQYDAAHFPATLTVPQVYIFNKGYYVDAVNQNKLTNYSFFKPAIDSFTNKPLGNFAYTLKGIQKFEEDYPDGEIIPYYSSLSENMKEVYSSYYYDKQKQNYLLVDLSLADNEVKDYLS